MLALLPKTHVDLDLSRDHCTLQVGGFCFNANGLDVTGQPKFEEWELAMRVLGTVNHRIVKPFKLWVCLMLFHGECHYGETYTQAMDQTGLSYSTLANAKSTIRRYARQREDGTYDTSGWHPHLSFEHHAVVAHLPPEEREKWLNTAEREHLTTEEIRAAIKPQRNGFLNTFICPCCGSEFETNRTVKVIQTIKKGKP